VSVDPLVLVDELDRSTDRLLSAVEKQPAESVPEPSLLPGWSRGHVLTHLARQADALLNHYTWVRTGVETPAYASQETRAADIEAGAGRPLAEQLDDLRSSCARLSGTRPLAVGRGVGPLHRAARGAAGRPPGSRGGGCARSRYTTSTCSSGTPRRTGRSRSRHRLLHEVASGLRGLDLTLDVAGLGHPVHVGAGGDAVVAGSAADLAAWLTGRSTGAGLTTPDGSPLPTLPTWM